MAIFISILAHALLIACLICSLVSYSKKVHIYERDLHRAVTDEDKEVLRSEIRKCKSKLTKRLISGIAVYLVMFVSALSFTIIPTGYTGVVSRFGQISETPLSVGFNWKAPFVDKVELVNNKQQNLNIGSETKVWSETSSRTAIYYQEITITYTIDGNESSWIVSNVNNYERNLITNDIVASAIKSSSKQFSDTDATDRSKIESKVTEMLQESLDSKYGKQVVYINKVTIGNIDFEDSYNQAIAEKQKAQILLEQQAITNQTNIDKAEAEAQVKLTEAQANAEATLVEAKAKAEANELLQESLTPDLLYQNAIEKWNGQLPTTMSGEGMEILLSK